MRKGSRFELNLEYFPDRSLVNVMVEHPILIERPIALTSAVRSGHYRRILTLYSKPYVLFCTTRAAAVRKISPCIARGVDKVEGIEARTAGTAGSTWSCAASAVPDSGAVFALRTTYAIAQALP